MKKELLSWLNQDLKPLGIKCFSVKDAMIKLAKTNLTEEQILKLGINAIHKKRIAKIIEMRKNPNPSPPPREQEIIRLRNSGLTLSEIGEKFNLSKERIRQIYNQWKIVDNNLK